jgi:Nuclease-related domain
VILKEIDPKENLERYQQYGHNAEKQMAFYLKRAFQDSKDIHVLNDLRLEMNDDVAQIDHLILHRFGFLVIESKSVTSKISVNEHGEWVRYYPKFTRGMPSPVNQAIRQTDFLKNFLMARSEYLLKKALIFKSSISSFKFDVLVAISDSGIINRAKNTIINEVHKADQITENVEKIIKDYENTNKKLLSLKMNFTFVDATMERISNYLLQSHKPKNADEEVIKDEVIKNEVIEIVEKKEDESVMIQAIENEIEAVTEEIETKKCGKCESTDIEMASGKYGYYFKCKECKGNTALKLKCKEASCKPRIRKAKLKFYKECSSCGTSELYFENEISVKAQLPVQ